ncbi:molybdate ABC transporter substrate-binding protein [Microbacterium xanthum]|uniref:molybdate ABC transporter substrate-binding protein n=1 Tax=Microbacterium xanthum TaxID=3079794 RepID=UPI002AD44539|nr:molybdate ABC transporter substrate-binding protein [Microbacterium sp. KSW-48]MDZ8171845.1 molybdate ABC transporter substrate-binding protein [Microbacterium sp. KSW-48]
MAAIIGTVALVLSGCAAPAEDGSLRIYAAASLRNAFDDLVEGFAAAHPDILVAPVVYDGSSTLATQILESAPADVFASADETTMASVVDAGLGSDPVRFATNTLVLVVPEGNPAGLAGLADVAEPEVSFVRCADEVPCGSAALRLLDAAGVDAEPVSLEQNVTAVVTKVAAGEADAGLVYGTDAMAEPRVATIAVPGSDDVVNHYPIVAVDPDDPAAALFVAYVLSVAGRAVLASYGFGTP